MVTPIAPSSGSQKVKAETGRYLFTWTLAGGALDASLLSQTNGMQREAGARDWGRGTVPTLRKKLQ